MQLKKGNYNYHMVIRRLKVFFIFLKSVVHFICEVFSQYFKRHERFR